MDEAIMVKCLAQGHSAATGQAGMRTHILTTPELESNALDRSATTLHLHVHVHNTCTFYYLNPCKILKKITFSEPR